jgi:hypothetical protein
MANQQAHFFDTFTAREADRMEVIMAELDSVPWAQRLLHEVHQNGGLVGKNMARFFELRFGHAVHKAGLSVEDEVLGEGDSTLDFGFTSKGQPWKVEMMRLQETQAAKAATTTEIDENGIRWTKQILSSNNEDKRQSPEGETLKAIERICQKCERDGKPHKFPKPDKALHAILVDMRTFKDGGDVHDRVHIGLGGEYVKEPYRMYWGEGKERTLISGVFGPQTEVKGSVEARQRVHFIGFVRERTFQPGEFGAVLEFVVNPYLSKDAAAIIKTAINTWPLKPARVLNGADPPASGHNKATIEPDGIWPGMWRIRLSRGYCSDMVNLTRAKDAAPSGAKVVRANTCRTGQRGALNDPPSYGPGLHASSLR